MKSHSSWGMPGLPLIPALLFFVLFFSLIYSSSIFLDYSFQGAGGIPSSGSAAWPMRGAAVLCLSVFTYLLAGRLCRDGEPPLEAFLKAAALGTLPSFQISIAALPWQSLALCLSLAGILLCDRLRTEESSWRRGAGVLGILLLWGTAAALHPPAVWAAGGLLLVPSPKTAGRPTGTGVPIFALAGLALGVTALSYAIPHGLSSLSFELGHRGWRRLQGAITDVLGFWAVDEGRGAIAVIVAAVTLGGGGCGIAACADPALRRKYAVRWLAALGFFAGSVAWAGMVPGFASYASLTGATCVAWILFLDGLKEISSRFPSPSAFPAALLALGVLGGFWCQEDVLKYFSYPLTLDSRMVRNEIRHYTATHSEVGEIRVTLRRENVLRAKANQEYGWTALRSGDSAIQLVRESLRRLGLDETVPILVEEGGTAASPLPPGVLRIDLSRADLR